MNEHDDPLEAELAAALDAAMQFINRFVWFRSMHEAVAVTLYVALTHCYERFDSLAYLHITSPVMGAGKTLTVDVIELLVDSPWRVANPSAAVVFRNIDKSSPTMLWDEIDTVFEGRSADNADLRGLLNLGNRKGAKVPRVASESNYQMREFAVFCPKVLVGIGELPDTVADRSIPIRMKRLAPGERTEPFRRKKVQVEADAIRERLSRAVAHVPDDGPWLEDLGHRAADGWEPLLAIATAAGPQWAARGRSAARRLSSPQTRQDNWSIRERLLADCYRVFTEEKMFSTDLVSRLSGLEDAGWADLDGRPLTPNRLAGLLKPFDIRPATIRAGNVTKKGYARSAFEDAWNRYLPAERQGDGVTDAPLSAEGVGECSEQCEIPACTDPGVLLPNGERLCDLHQETPF